MNTVSECRFCQLANGEISAYVVFEDDFVCCFLANEPFSEGHTLIVPKRHYLDLDELDQQTAEHVMKASITISEALKKEFRPDGISIMQNGGVFNDVGHYHMHVFCRYRGDGFGWKYADVNNDRFYSGKVRDKLRKAIVEVIKGQNTS